MWIRHVLVPGVTDDKENLHGIRAFLDTLSNVKKVEVLPYHTLGIYKWESLGIPYTLKDVDPPTAESVKRAEEILVRKNLDRREYELAQARLKRALVRTSIH